MTRLPSSEWRTEAYVALICASSPSWKDFSEIYDATNEEIEQGYVSHYLSKRELDQNFGEGGWRPLLRFMVTQPSGKQRPIDNAKASGHNAATRLKETIRTKSLDFVPQVARDIVRSDAQTHVGMSEMHLNKVDPPPPAEKFDTDFSPTVDPDDLTDAYRQDPVSP